MYVYKSRGIVAHGAPVSSDCKGGFVVFKGSTGVVSPTAQKKRSATRRQDLIDQGILVLNPRNYAEYVFSQDYRATSVTNASEMIVGSNASAKPQWINVVQAPL